MKNPIYPREMLHEIGHGQEKIVYEIDGDKKKVAGEYYADTGNEEMVRADFYLTKILHYFLSEIPDIHLSSSLPNMVVREKVDLDPAHIAINKDYSRGFGSQLPRHEQYAVPFTDNLKEEFGVWIDRGITNFSISDNGEVKYVDTVNAFIERRSIKRYVENFDISKIRAKIATVANLKDRLRLTGWADRLEALSGVFLKKIN